MSDLEFIANALTAPGKGLLAADESITTCGKRLEKAGLENTEVSAEGLLKAGALVLIALPSAAAAAASTAAAATSSPAAATPRQSSDGSWAQQHLPGALLPHPFFAKDLSHLSGRGDSFWPSQLPADVSKLLLCIVLHTQGVLIMKFNMTLALLKTMLHLHNA